MSLTINLGDSLQRGNARLRLPGMTTGEFWEFCQRNPDVRAERSAAGDLILMTPTGGETGKRNIKIGRFLDEWAERDGTGIAFDSSTLFRLPNGAERSPDASWVHQERWDALSEDDREAPAPLCPEFVIELMSPSDRLRTLQVKMHEYLINGTLLGFLIDRKRRRVHVYRPNAQVEVLDNPAEIYGDPELPGFVLRMDRIF